LWKDRPFDTKRGVLTERKLKVTKIYDGYVFQLYAQCFSLRELGHSVKEIRFYSLKENKIYTEKLPEENPKMFDKFENTVKAMHAFDVDSFMPSNLQKCQKCIYAELCDRALVAV